MVKGDTKEMKNINNFFITKDGVVTMRNNFYSSCFNHSLLL